MIYIEIDVPDYLPYPNEEDEKYNGPPNWPQFEKDCDKVEKDWEEYCKQWVTSNLPNYTFFCMRDLAECDGLSFNAELK
jgi:hypothetical protein